MKKIISASFLAILALVSTGCAETAQPAIEQKTAEQEQTATTKTQTAQPAETEKTYTLTGEYSSGAMFGGEFIFFTPSDYSSLPEGVKGEYINSKNSEEAMKMLNIDLKELGCTDYYGTATIEITNLEFVKSDTPPVPDAWVADITKVIKSEKPVCEVF